MRRKVEQNAEEQAAAFLERAKSLDLNSTDVKVTAAVAGLGLAAVAAYLASRRLGNKARAADGEEVTVAVEPTEYMKGVASVVRKNGNAASFPMGDAVAAERLDRDNDGGIFIIEGLEVVRSPQGDPRYMRAASWVIGFAQHVLRPQLPEEIGHGQEV